MKHWVEIASDTPAWIMKPLPRVSKRIIVYLTALQLFENSVQSPTCVLQRIPGFVWVFPYGDQLAEVLFFVYLVFKYQLYIYLQSPCLVTDVAFTMMCGADPATEPQRFNLRVGPYLDSLDLVLQVLLSLTSSQRS